MIEILEDISRQKLVSGWQFLTLDNVSPATGRGPFALMGYPNQLVKDQPPAGIVYFSDRIIEPPSIAPNLNPEIDLFFEYRRKVMKEGIEEVDAPDLKGTSGASVWECSYTGDDLWTPAKILKVVGVQSAQWKGEYWQLSL